LSALSNLFLAPELLAFLAFLPVVVLLYLLKLRRTEIVIPSTMLWIKSLQDLTANAPFQRLRKNLLLFLQLLALALMALALARPYLKAEGTRGGNLCVIVDRSASMQTKEDDESRLDLAKKQALDLVERMASGDRMMVVSFADTAVVCCELTDDRRRLRNAIDEIIPSDGTSNIRDVMMIARSLAPGDKEKEAVVSDIELILISDGRLSDLQELGALSKNVSFLRIGKTNDNAGIVRFSLRNPEEGAGERQVYVRILNEASNALDATLTLYFDADPLAVEELHVPEKQSSDHVFALPKIAESGLLRAELDHVDALGVDNRAWLALRTDAFLRVLLVGETDSLSASFLRRALTLDPRVQLSAVAPADYADTGDYDLTIFCGVLPPLGPDNTPVWPAGALFFVNAVPALPGLRAEGEIANPPLLAVDPDHPLTRFLHPGNTRISKAQKLVLPEGARTLISTEGGALLADVSHDGQPVVVAAFDLADSNWPLHLSFPLFIQNLIGWLPRAAMAGQSSIAVGAPIELFGAPQEASARVTLPDGTPRTIALDPMRPVLFGETSKAGPYIVTRSAGAIPVAGGEGEAAAGEKKEYYAVNLLDANESSITPVERLNLGRTEIAAQTESVWFNREYWRWLLAGVLAVLVLEWWLYSRRAWL